jgi:hypothetical protein
MLWFEEAAAAAAEAIAATEDNGKVMTRVVHDRSSVNWHSRDSLL